MLDMSFWLKFLSFKMQRISTKINLYLFFSIFLVLLCMHFCFGINESQYYWDSGNYYIIGKSMFIDGKFSLFNICSDFRGVVFPFFMGVCYWIENTLHVNNAFYYLSSAILSILICVFFNFTVLLFANTRKLSGKSIVLRCYGALALLIIFFYGLIVYPLTDLYSALLCISSAYLLLVCFIEFKELNYFLCLLSGCFIYLAYNIRPIYLLSLLVFSVLLFFLGYKRIQWYKLVICEMLYCLGVAIAAIPQFILNWHLYQEFSPWVKNDNLFAQQLYWGLQYSRYATYTGSSLATSKLFFIDEAGVQIANEWVALGYPVTLGSYIKMIITHPLQYAGILGRHIINAFFILFPEQYITTLNKNTIIFAFISLLVVFAGLVLIFVKTRQHTISWGKCILVFSVILPSIAILLGAVEERFLVLPYLLLYGYISFFDWSILKSHINKKSVVCTICFLIVFCVISIVVENDILSNLKDFPLHLMW